jgi:hypothetical protein
MKTRSSSGVGQKVDLEFNVDTLRITDLGEEEQESSLNQQRSQNGGSSIYQGLKRTSSVSSTEESATTSTTWERASPKEGFDLSKPKTKAGSGPMIRNMMSTIANLNPEKD